MAADDLVIKKSQDIISLGTVQVLLEYSGLSTRSEWVINPLRAKFFRDT